MNSDSVLEVAGGEIRTAERVLPGLKWGLSMGSFRNFSLRDGAETRRCRLEVGFCRTAMVWLIECHCDVQFSGAWFGLRLRGGAIIS